jgi:hypothetical protein
MVAGRPNYQSANFSLPCSSTQYYWLASLQWDGSYINILTATIQLWVIGGGSPTMVYATVGAGTVAYDVGLSENYSCCCAVPAVLTIETQASGTPPTSITVNVAGFG